MYQRKVTSSLACIHGQVTKHTTVKWPILLASAYYKNIESRARLFKKITRSAVTLQLRDKGFSRQKEVSVESDEVLM